MYCTVLSLSGGDFNKPWSKMNNGEFEMDLPYVYLEYSPCLQVQLLRA
jgi:hypothetical protein